MCNGLAIKTELKTLKDFDVDDDYIIARTKYVADIDKLRQEAKKWILYIRKKEGINDKIEGSVIIWIKHFFNITEEDLKEND